MIAGKSEGMAVAICTSTGGHTLASKASRQR